MDEILGYIRTQMDKIIDSNVSNKEKKEMVDVILQDLLNACENKM